MQKANEPAPINIYAQLMEPSQPSQENEVLVQMMRNQVLNQNGTDNSLQEILNYPPEQLKILMD